MQVEHVLDFGHTVYRDTAAFSIGIAFFSIKFILYEGQGIFCFHLQEELCELCA